MWGGEACAWPIARITLEVTIPPADTVMPVVLRYEDGLQGSGSPVTNAVTLNNATTHLPTLGTLTLYLNDCNGNGVADGTDIASGTSADCNGNGVPDSCDIASGTSNDANADGIPDECPPPGGFQRPGDANQDGTLDLSDAIWLLGHLFLGTTPTLPCEGGSASNPGDGERRLLDVNGDGGVDLSDAIRVLGFLFTGGPAPALGKECVRIVGCPDRSEKCAQ
jgi:hypothetical protein